MSLISINFRHHSPYLHPKKAPAAPPFFVVVFFFLTDKSRRWHVDASHWGTVPENRSIYITSNRPFEHLLFCAGRGGAESGLLFLKEKKNLLNPSRPPTFFSFLTSFAPFFHSCFPYSSPNFRLISEINIHEADCNDQSTSWWGNMKGFWRPVTVTSSRQNVLPVIHLFFVLSGSVLSSRAYSLTNKHKKHFWRLVAFFSCGSLMLLFWGVALTSPRKTLTPWPKPNPILQHTF